MRHFDFIIVGGGSSGQAALDTLLNETSGKSILLINAEQSLPYKRTSVSKNIVKGYHPDSFSIHPKEWYAENGVELIYGRAVIRLHTDDHQLDLEEASFSYSKLLLSTGARPRVPCHNLHPSGQYSTLWTVTDGLVIHDHFHNIKTLAVIGAGVLGIEVAWQATLAGVKTMVLGRDKWPMMTLLDQQGASSLEKAMQQASVSLLLERDVTDVVEHNDGTGVLITTDKGFVEADCAVLLVGGEPEVSLARTSGIRVKRGILVDATLKTSASNVWAAGDCAEHDAGLITGLWHAAEHQGRLAALSMLGHSVHFENLPFRLKCEAFGGYWFSAGPVNATTHSGNLKAAESLETNGILWRPRFQEGRLRALSAAAPQGMDKEMARVAQELLLKKACREKVFSVLKGA